jgi:hypothetical protein
MLRFDLHEEVNPAQAGIRDRMSMLRPLDARSRVPISKVGLDFYCYVFLIPVTGKNRV